MEEWGQTGAANLQPPDRQTVGRKSDLNAKDLNIG